MGQVLDPNIIRKLRAHLGLSGSQFATVLGVHPTTVSRWENAKEPVVVEGMAWTVLAGLAEHMENEKRAAQEAREAGQQIQNALLVGGVLLALAILVTLAAKRK